MGSLHTIDSRSWVQIYYIVLISYDLEFSILLKLKFHGGTY